MQVTDEGAGAVRDCWVVIVTKGLRVWLPPEVYLQTKVAAREITRWVGVLSKGRTLPAGEPIESPVRAGRDVLLHVVPTGFLEPWHACPVWVGVHWSRSTYPKLDTKLFVASSEEAHEWVGGKAGRRAADAEPAALGHEALFIRRGVETYVAALQVKRLHGP